MLRDRMNKLVGSKVFNIIFAVLVSFALWFYIAYAENTDVEQQYSNIDVVFDNDDVITERSLVVTDIDTETLSLKILGKRNAISKLSKSAIIITADLSIVSSNGVWQIPYDVEYTGVSSSALTIREASADYITVTVGKLVEKDILIEGEYDVEIAEGFNAEPLEFSPEKITVSGPEEIVTKIDCAWVKLKRDSVSKTVVDTLPYDLLDKDDNIIQTEHLTLSTERITVTLPIVMVKDVPLSVNLVPGAGASDANTKVTIEPAYITLSGDAAILSELNEISLETIDLTDFETTFTDTYPIKIPNGVTNNTGATEANVTVQVLGLTTTRLSVTNISASNATDGYKVSIITQSLDVTVRGNSTDIGLLKADNIRIVADLTSLGNALGTFQVEAKIHIDGYPELGVVGNANDYKISVTVSKS